MIKKLFSFVGKYKKDAILTPITVSFEVILEVAIPFIMSFIIDRGIKQGSIKTVVIYGAIMVLIAALALVFGALSARFAAKAGVGFAKNLREAIFSKAQDFSFYNLDKYSTASLVTRLTTDVSYIQNTFMMAIRVAFRAPLMLILATTMVIVTNAKLSFIFLSILPVLLIVVGILAKKAHPLFDKMFKMFDKMNSRVQENLVGIRVVKSFVRENHETNEFRKASDMVMNAQKKAEKIMVYAMPIVTLAMFVSMLTVIWFGGNSIIKGEMEEGQLMSFLTYIMQILISLIMMSMVFVMLVMSRASAKRIIEVLDEQIDITDENADKSLKVEDGSIKFENVSFSYKKDAENLIFENLNLEIKSGETIGIIGGTGSSKTSLVQLILRLYDVSAGAVYVGGHDVKNYSIKTLRDAAGIVLQKNTLFSGTIEDNLRWGNMEATEEEIIAAAKNAEAHSFISSFPDGYKTMIEQGGTNVSGGQKQRLCIARALLKNPKIMILDDSTSAVDTATDAKIRKALKENLKDTTVVIIAQRIASVIDADKVIVLKDGKIDGMGSHEQLIESNEIYKEVYLSQQKGDIQND